MKIIITTNSFIAGAVIDDDTRIVRECDHFLAHLRGMKEQEFRDYCTKQKWAIANKD
jgi:hypothetical protein